MKTIKICDVDVDIHDGPIGISCSGGADSALLLYLLMKHATGPIHIFTCSLDVKNRSSILSSNNVINECLNLTGNYNIFYHVHYTKNPTTVNELFSNQNTCLTHNIINVLYTGITANPPFDVQSTFNMPSLENHERNPDEIRPLYTFENKIYTPLTNINKQTVVNMYSELGILDSLFPVTRSCESFTLTQGHCGECWWCQERNWAVR